MRTMTSRERVTRAARRLPVDRMPIDLGVHFSTGISVFAYWNLRKYLGMPTDSVELIDCTQMLARVDEDVLDRFHVDTVLLNPPFAGTHAWNPRGDFSFQVPDTFQPVRMPDGAWRIEDGPNTGYMPAGGFFFDGAWPDYYRMAPADRLRAFARRAEALYKETDRFTLQMGFSGFFDGIDFACDMITDPEACMAYNERRLADQIARFDAVNRAYGRYIGALEVNSDLGMQSGPMCRPDTYEAVCMPYLKRFCRHVHETSDILVFMHSCGSIVQLLPFIIEAGVDILNPVQISAAGMDPQALKERFGRSIAFWGGGCDTQSVLWQATPDAVTEHVREMVAIFAKDSGFIFNQVHNIMGNVPPENIVAMLDTAYACAVEMGG